MWLNKARVKTRVERTQKVDRRPWIPQLWKGFLSSTEWTRILFLFSRIPSLTWSPFFLLLSLPSISFSFSISSFFSLFYPSLSLPFSSFSPFLLSYIPFLHIPSLPHLLFLMTFPFSSFFSSSLVTSPPFCFTEWSISGRVIASKVYYFPW